jgi:transcription-repair coupling factor (superfamily II helicase)
VKKAKKTKKARAAPALKKAGSLPGAAISSSSPLGMLALHLLQQWRKSGRDGVVFLAGDENRAERLASIVHSLDRSSGVLVFPRLNNLPFDGLEPSREIAGRRSSVLRRLAKSKKPVFLVSTAEAIMERLPLPESLTSLSVVLKLGAKYAEQDLQPVSRLWAMISRKRRNFRVRRSFTARRSRSFQPAPSIRSASSTQTKRSARLSL